ncbi:protein O-mannosyl-transferase TMTC1-like [Ornithodoros turicata]
MGCEGWIEGADPSTTMLHGYVSTAASSSKFHRRGTSCVPRPRWDISWSVRWSASCARFHWPRSRTWSVSWLPALCAALLSLLCYLNSLDGDFVHDDMVAVVGNRDVTGEHALSALWVNDFWGRPMADPQSHKSYRPLTVLTFRANHYASGGLEVRGFHGVNVALHVACSVLVARVASEALGLTAGPSALSALLFAAHPVHTEAVSSIVGRAEVLCCFFFLVAFLCYHRSCQASNSGLRVAVWLCVCSVCSACALLAKEQGITVLPLCLLLRLRTLVSQTSALRQPWWRRIFAVIQRCLLDLRVILLTSVLGALLTFRLWILHGSLPRFSEVDNPASFSPHILTRFLTYSHLSAFNAWLTLFPGTLSYDWQMGSIPLVTSLSDPRNVMTLALAAGMLGLLWRACPSRCDSSDGSEVSSSRQTLVALLLTVLPFLPASNLLVVVGFVVAERVLYIPSIGLCLLVALGLQRLLDRSGRRVRITLVGAACALVALLAARTLHRNRVWESRESLFESGIQDLPENAKMHYNFANLQKDLGNTDLAIKHYNTAIELWPEHASAHNNLGTVVTSPQDAERHFRAALRINPNHPGAHFNLANMYSKQGQIDVARHLLQRAVELDPDFAEAYSSLAHLAAEDGHVVRAEALHKMALNADPRNADARNNYGTFLQTQGRVEEAVREYQTALALQPNHTVALLNAARTLRSMKLNREAENLYKRALSVQEDPQVMDNLAVFYINAGRLDEAKDVYEKVDLLFPDHLDSKVHHAQLMMRQRCFQAAEDLLLATVARNGSNRDALHQTALLYNHTNRTTEALEYILRALQLCSVDDRSCAQLHAEHGDILKDLNDLNSSAESYGLAIRLDPNLAHAHLNLAVIKHLQGDYARAFQHYQTAFMLDPKNQLIIDNMEKLRRRLTGAENRKPKSSATTDAAFELL